MNRRIFLQVPILASISRLVARSPIQFSKNKGFVVRAGRDRHDSELDIMGGVFDCKVSAKDTDGAFCMFDTIRHEKGGPALHLHYSQDELFYVIKGRFRIKVGDDVFDLKPGDFAFAPRMIPHAFAMTSDGDGQMLVSFQPAGSMENFFKRMSKLFGKNIPANRQELMKQLWAEHGMKVMGPPLPV